MYKFSELEIEERREYWEENQNLIIALYDMLGPILKKKVDHCVENCPDDWWIFYGAVEIAALTATQSVMEYLAKFKTSEEKFLAWRTLSLLPNSTLAKMFPAFVAIEADENICAYALYMSVYACEELEDLKEFVVTYSHGHAYQAVGCDHFGCVAPPAEAQESLSDEAKQKIKEVVDAGENETTNQADS